METLTPATGGTKDHDASLNQPYLYSETAADDDKHKTRVAGFVKDKWNCVANEIEENPALIGDVHLTILKQKEKELNREVAVRSSELEHLEHELELMTAASEMFFGNQHSVDFYMDRLNEQLQAKSHYLLNLEIEWDAVRKPLELRKRSLEESLYSNDPNTQQMLQKLREVQQEEEFILSEIIKREEEHSKLSADLQKQPKVASRKSYTRRIHEITKNSRKQGADIERILKETREVQLESNTLQERLHRTYAIADEIVFRETKKDPTGQQVYRLLASIHEGFEQISEEILATDRIKREIAEYEMKLAATASKSLDMSKLQADLDAIVIGK